MRRPSSAEPSDDPLDLLFYALSDRTRRRLLSQLALGPAKVTDLAKPFRMSLPAVSKHLKVLEHAHLVSRSIDGRVHRLTLRGSPLEQVETWLDPFRAYWAGTLAALEDDLAAHPITSSRTVEKKGRQPREAPRDRRKRRD